MKFRHLKFEQYRLFVCGLYPMSPYQVLLAVDGEIERARAEYNGTKSSLRWCLGRAGSPGRVPWCDRKEAMDNAVKWHDRLLELAEWLGFLRKMNVMAYVIMYNIEPYDKYLAKAWGSAEKLMIDAIPRMPAEMGSVLIEKLWRH